MDWLESLPAFLVAVAVVFFPGLAISWALGLRRSTMLAIAPLAGVSVIAVTSFFNHFLGFHWGIVPVVATTVLLAGVVLGIRVPWARRVSSTVSTEPRSYLGSFLIGLVIAFLAIAARLLAIFGQPSHISQTFDNVYHLNAVRYIVDTGDASPLRISSLTAAFDGSGSFYPDAWHSITALVVQLTGSGIPAAANVVSIVIAGLIWPIGCMLLVRVVVGARPLAVVAAAVLSAAFAAYPYLMLDFGVLYPNVLSIALLPATIALVVVVCGLASDAPMSIPSRWLALVAALPGLALAHPSTLIALIAFSVPIVAIAIYRMYRGMAARKASKASYVWRSALVFAGTAIAVVLLLVARPTSEAAFWGPRESPWSAIWSAFSSATMSRPVDWVVTGLLVIGVWAIWKRPNARWLLFSYAIACGLYVVSAGFPHSYLRYGLTGTWYNDPTRLASLIPALSLPIAVAGAVWLVDAIRALVQRRAGTVELSAQRKVLDLATASVMVVFILVATQFGAPLRAATASASVQYEMGKEAPLLSDDERILLERLASEVPEGTTVFGSPWTGTSLVYAISDRRAIMPAIYGDRDALTQLLMDGIDEAGDRPEVCEAVRELNAWYILDFGAHEVHGAEHLFLGLDSLEDSSSVELVDEQGAARLFRVTACG